MVSGAGEIIAVLLG